LWNCWSIGFSQKLYEENKQAEKHTEATIITMINVARMCKDDNYEKELWNEKIELSDKRHSVLSNEEENRQQEVMAFLSRKCVETFKKPPIYNIRHTETEGHKKWYVSEVMIGDISLGSAESKNKMYAVLKSAFRALDRISEDSELIEYAITSTEEEST